MHLFKHDLVTDNSDVVVQFNGSTQDFDILKVIFNKNFTSPIVSANSVYKGHNS